MGAVTHGKEVVKEVKYDDKGQLRILTGSRWRLAEESECYFCGQSYIRMINRTRPGIYCSDPCRARSRRKEAIKRMVWKKCIICYRNYKVKACSAHRYATCGRYECHTELRRQHAKARQGIGGFGVDNQFSRKRTKEGQFAK